MSFDWSEVGFEFAAGVHSETTSHDYDHRRTAVGTVYQPADLYTLYYGRRLCNGGEFKVYAGLANGLGGIVGFERSTSPSAIRSRSRRFLLHHRRQGSRRRSIPGESANLAFSLVWHPGCHARDTFDSAYRPLFNVADNSSFIVNRRTLP